MDWQTWNDGTVPKLAQTIFDGRRYDLLPILADALEEAGYPDAALPARFRTPLAPVTAVRLLAPVVGGELAESVKWLENLAAELGPTKRYHADMPEYDIHFDYPAASMEYEDLIAAAERWSLHGDYTVQHGSERWRDLFHGKVVDDFWVHYSAVTSDYPESPQGFFDCSC